MFKTNNFDKWKKGFSLVELLVVIAIIGILATGGGVYYSQAQKQSRDLKRQSDIGAIQSALELYYSDEKQYPKGTKEDGSWVHLSVVEKAIVPNYINNLPSDPKNIAPYQYSYYSNGDGNWYVVDAALEINKADSLEGSYTSPYSNRDKGSGIYHLGMIAHYRVVGQ